jgi:hypothetical protein
LVGAEILQILLEAGIDLLPPAARDYRIRRGLLLEQKESIRSLRAPVLDAGDVESSDEHIAEPLGVKSPGTFHDYRPVP